MLKIEPGHPQLQYSGRIDRSDPAAYPLVWPATAIAARFTGTSLQLCLESTGDDHFNVFVDGQLTILHGNPARSIYPLAAGLPEGAHTVQLFKRTEMLGPVTFKGLVLDEGSSLLEPPAPSPRRIEFYGDSVTVGQSNEDGAEDQ
jgi:hypothetical protein